MPRAIVAGLNRTGGSGIGSGGSSSRGAANKAVVANDRITCALSGVSTPWMIDTLHAAFSNSSPPSSTRVMPKPCMQTTKQANKDRVREAPSVDKFRDAGSFKRTARAHPAPSPPCTQRFDGDVI